MFSKSYIAENGLIHQSCLETIIESDFSDQVVSIVTFLKGNLMNRKFPNVILHHTRFPFHFCRCHEAVLSPAAFFTPAACEGWWGFSGSFLAAHSSPFLLLRNCCWCLTCPVCVCTGLIRTVCVSLLTEILLKSQNTCLLCATTTVTWQKLSAVIDFDILVKTDSADLLLTFLHQCGTFKEILTLSYMYITTCLSQWMSTFFNPCWMSQLNLF